MKIAFASLVLLTLSAIMSTVTALPPIGLAAEPDVICGGPACRVSLYRFCVCG